MLVAVAHPDDETLTCGGTIAKFRSEGHTVVTAFFCAGEGSGVWHYGIDGLEDRDPSLAANAVKHLGVEDVRLLGFEDQTLDMTPMRQLGDVFMSLVRDVQPDVVITHHPGDLNGDHKRVSEAALIAARPHVTPKRWELWFGWCPSGSETAYGVGEAFSPNLWVELNDPSWRDAKDEALAVYDDEIKSFPHPRSIEGMRAHEQFWGTFAGMTHAEPFQVHKRFC